MTASLGGTFYDLPERLYRLVNACKGRANAYPAQFLSERQSPKLDRRRQEHEKSRLCGCTSQGLEQKWQTSYLRLTLSGPPNAPRLESLIGDRPQLDALIINIELTLTSIIQGVALSFLCENATAALSHGRIQDLPYIANGLLLILLFWSRSIGHTLTLIRWPLDFTHNFFYFGAAFLEAVTFGQIGNPVGWYGTLACFSIVVWLLFILDLRLISRRTKDASGQRLEQLMIEVRKDQNLNIYCLVPALIAFHAVAAWFCFEANARWPDWVLLPAIVQFVSFAAYLVYFLKTMARLFIHVRPAGTLGPIPPG